jgi:c(7)-type cytochrome triheme protein
VALWCPSNEARNKAEAAYADPAGPCATRSSLGRIRGCGHQHAKTKAGASGITMDQISQGRFCGACHNGEIAWSVENCDFCHSGVPGLETGVQGGHETSGPGYW